MIDTQTNNAMHAYSQAYQQLYRRTPNDLRMLDQGWVIVNGARMQVHELEFLTHQLQLEYDRERARQRGIVQRLMNWFRQ